MGHQQTTGELMSNFSYEQTIPEFERHKHKLYMRKWRQRTTSVTRPQFIYVAVAGEHIKVGIAENPKARVRQIASCNPILDVQQTYVSSVKFKNAAEVERYIHAELKEYKVSMPHCREWFKCEQYLAVRLIEQVVSESRILT